MNLFLIIYDFNVMIAFGWWLNLTSIFQHFWVHLWIVLIRDRIISILVIIEQIDGRINLQMISWSVHSTFIFSIDHLSFQYTFEEALLHLISLSFLHQFHQLSILILRQLLEESALKTSMGVKEVIWWLIYA